MNPDGKWKIENKSADFRINDNFQFSVFNFQIDGNKEISVAKELLC